MFAAQSHAQLSANYRKIPRTERHGERRQSCHAATAAAGGRKAEERAEEKGSGCRSLPTPTAPVESNARRYRPLVATRAAMV
ncbi:hypothetical protein AVEN_193863-1 [Araneus ventricosus]|uniref:Uncharacterized protein n=1 Tax=Araneus ventricosus TaxID=182803 RepID=A0A4Y2V3I3_ARAVE|nr:hypothetical protein AVEN_193863-1 [Araneus ventricosus]